MNYKDAVRAAYQQLRKDGVRASQALRSAKWDAKYDPQTKYGRKFDILNSRYDAYEGEQITELPNGWKIKVEFKYDSYSGPPQNNCDGLGVIKECHGTIDDCYENWILDNYRWGYRYYDWKETLPEALRDKWNTKPYNFTNKHEQAMAAMKSTYEYLRRWYNDDWWYVGIIVTLLDENDEELQEDSCWGYESNCMDYLCSEARSRANWMIRKERKDRRAASDDWRQYKLNLETA